MLVLRSSALGRSSSSALGACAIAKPATPNVVITTVIAATVTTRMIRFTADVPPSSRCAFSAVQRPCGIILESQRYWKVKGDPLAPRRALSHPGNALIALIHELPRRGVLGNSDGIRHNSRPPASLLGSERKLQKNRRFASCICLHHLIGCYCVLLRKGSESTETIPGFVRHLRALLLSLRLGGGLPLFRQLPRRGVLGNWQLWYLPFSETLTYQEVRLSSPVFLCTALWSLLLLDNQFPHV